MLKLLGKGRNYYVPPGIQNKRRGRPPGSKNKKKH